MRMLGQPPSFPGTARVPRVVTGCRVAPLALLFGSWRSAPSAKSLPNPAAALPPCTPPPLKKKILGKSLLHQSPGLPPGRKHFVLFLFPATFGMFQARVCTSPRCLLPRLNNSGFARPSRAPEAGKAPESSLPFPPPCTVLGLCKGAGGAPGGAGPGAEAGGMGRPVSSGRREPLPGRRTSREHEGRFCRRGRGGPQEGGAGGSRSPQPPGIALPGRYPWCYPNTGLFLLFQATSCAACRGEVGSGVVGPVAQADAGRAGWGQWHLRSGDEEQPAVGGGHLSEGGLPSTRGFGSQKLKVRLSQEIFLLLVTWRWICSPMSLL